MTTTTQPTAATSPAATPAPLAPTRRPGPGWGSEFAARLLGGTASSSSTAEKAAPSPAPPMTYAKAAGLAVLDAGEVGALGLLFGAAHAKGMLDIGGVAIDGIIGLLGLAASVGASVRYPLASRIAGNVGLGGIFSFGFRKGHDAVLGEKPTTQGKEPTPPRPAAHSGEDPIARVARELDL